MTKDWMYYLYTANGIREATAEIEKDDPDMAAHIRKQDADWYAKILLSALYPEIWQALYNKACELEKRNGVHV